MMDIEPRESELLQPAPLAAGTIIQDRYQLSSELGQGGMGIVYKADDLLLERIVAVKVLSKTDSSEDRRQLLLSEAQAAAKLNHPNVVAVYDAGEYSSVPYVVLEYIKGQTLREIERPSSDGVVSITMDICRALQHAHQHGIIHRDLKPENVMITSQGQVKLMDFGLARLSDRPRLTLDKALAGTINYLAPELILGKEATPQSDLYALGVILYELTTGKPPFEGSSLAVVLSNHLHAPVTPPSAHNQSISRPMDNLILELLEKEPENRPESALVVMDQLRLMQDPDYIDFSASETPVISLLDRIAAGRLVGRDEELAQATSLWLRALSGHASMLLISGEPGIGKTRLAQAIVAQARIGGSIILSGGCYEFEATTPYLPFSEALRQWVHEQDEPSLSAEMGDAAVELVRLAPEIESKLGPLTPNPDIGIEEQKLRLFDNLAQYFERLSTRKGLMLFIDDLHWADRGTLALLTYLIRRLRHARLMVIAAYREVELDRQHPLADALVDWNRQRVAIRIPLDRFSLEKTQKMIATLFQGQPVSDEFTEVIYRETDGNPFFIEEVVKALVDNGQIYWLDDHWEREEIHQLAIPQSIKEAIGRRLSVLSRSCIQTLHFAAVIGKDFTFSLLHSVTEKEEETLLDNLEEASQAQLLRQKGSESFIFTHDKIREVLYDEILTVRRVRLHAKIAESLEGSRTGEKLSEVEELAYHFISAGLLEKGMAYALEAATKAQQLFAGDDAISYLNQALECAVSLGDRQAQASILENIGDVYSVIGPFDKAVAYYEQAAEMSTARKPAIGVKIGLVLNISNDERGVSILKDSLDELDAEKDPLLVAQAFSALGRFHHYRCEYSAAIELYERARELAEPIGEPVSLGFIYSYFAGAYQHLAQLDKSLEWAHRAIELGEQTGYLVAIALGYEFIAEDNLIMGYWDRTIEAARVDLKMAEKVGSVARKSWSLWAIGYARYGKGELSECIEAIEETAEFASAAGENRLLALCYTVLALAHAEMGNESALEFADQAVEASRAMVEIFQLGHSLQIKGYTHLQLGDPEKAFESFEESRKLLDQTESRDVSLYRLPYQAEALLLLGKLKEAREDLDEIIPLAVEVGAPHYEAAARRVQGLYFYEKGDLSAAEESLLEAIKITERLGSRIELARANYALTLVKQKSKDLREAKTHGKRAEQLFEACGASRYLHEMRMLLDQLD